MKKKIALLLSTLALPFSLQAESTVESNVTVALKLYYNFDAPVTKGATTVVKHQTIAVKNADLIEAVNELHEVKFPLKSAIICRQFFNEAGDPSKAAVYLIRDKKLGERDITNHLIFFPVPIKATNANLKTISEGLSTGTISYVQTGASAFILNPGVQQPSTFQLQGLERITAKLIVNRQNDELVQLASLKSTVTGVRSGLPPLESLANGSAPVDGSFKTSGAKIVANKK